MAYAFAHMETYARSGGKSGKASARGIAAEAERQAHACPHVPNPQPPRLVAGVMPSEFVDQVEERAAEAKDPRGRKLRRDAQVLLGAVFSWHERSDAANAEQLERWIADVVEFARGEWGDQVGSVVLHLDEAHPHLHVLVAPELDERGGMHIRQVHPGVAARDALPDRGQGSKQAREEAYKTAMRDWQDRYYEQVAVRYGQARLGPQRQRLTRAEWQAQQAEQRRIAEQLQRAEAVEQQAHERLGEAEQEAEHIVNQARQAAEGAQRRAERADRAAQAAQRALGQAQAQIERLARPAAKFRAVLDALTAAPRRALEQRRQAREAAARREAEARLRRALGEAEQERMRQAERVAQLRERLRRTEARMATYHRLHRSGSAQLQEARARAEQLREQLRTAADQADAASRARERLRHALRSGDPQALERVAHEIAGTTKPRGAMGAGLRQGQRMR